jgi:RNA polymerase sigma-70 factor (ECF subfamily)
MGECQDDLEALYEQVRPRLRVTASRLVGWDDAEDVVQEAFVRALAFPGVFRRESSPLTWMTRIVLNTAIDETRKRKRRPSTVATPAFAEAGHGVMPQHPVCTELRAALAASSRGDREVLVLAGLLGFSYRETAERLGVSVSTTKSRLCSARMRLRHAMTGQDASVVSLTRRACSTPAAR